MAPRDLPSAFDLAGDASLAFAVEQLSERAEALLVREPMVERDLPRTSDVDLVAVGEAEDFLPERVAPDRFRRRLDVMWLPRSRLEAPEELATLGLIPHRLLGSRVVYDRTGFLTRQRDHVRSVFYDARVQEERCTGLLDMGFYTVREIGITWDFPALALFWLHMAHAACLAALVDGLGHFCPNVYTRPFDYLRLARPALGTALEEEFVEALRLDVDPAPLYPRLRRLHEAVSLRFPEPAWPDVMRQMTRYEYRYFGSRDELEWRISVAEELAEQGAAPAAVFYLRFWAYVLARLPMVYQRAVENIDVSFIRPSRAMRPELERVCPEILEDLSCVLGGEDGVVRGDVERSLDRLHDFRDRTLTFLSSRGPSFHDLKQWRPHEPAAAHAHRVFT